MTEAMSKTLDSSNGRASKRAVGQPRAFHLGSLAALLVMITLQTLCALGQINTATLSGSVKDSTGAFIAGASVAVVQTDTGTTRNVQTNADGIFTVPLLQPGVYSVTITASGFEKTTQPNIELQVNQSANLSFALTVGSVGETVTVSGSGSQLETETAALGTVIGEKEVEDLPLNGRQFIQLLQLAPGSVPVSVSQTAVPNLGGGSSNVTPSVNGGTGRSNLFFMDGIYATDPFFGSLSISPSIDAIQEFQEQTHTDSVKFGGATGATVNLATKAGTNQFHGTAYEFWRNQSLGAIPYFQTSNSTPYSQNQFGGTVGGPVLHNKLFFFGFYDGYRQTLASTNGSILPTTAELGGDFSALLPTTVIYDPTTYNAATQQSQPFFYNGKENVIDPSRLNQGILAMMKAYVPAPTVDSATGTGSCDCNYVNTASSTTNQDQYSVRIDYNVGSKDTIFGRFTKSTSTSISPSQLPSNSFSSGFDGNNSGGSWIHIFSPTLVSQITAGYSGSSHPQEYLEPGAAAAFQAGGFSAGFTDTPGGILVPKTPGLHPSGFFDLNGGWGPIGPEHLGQVSGSVNKQSGKHALIFGAAYYWTNMYTNWSENDIYFNNNATYNLCASRDVNNNCVSSGGNSLASMLIGLPNSAGLQLGNAGVSLRDRIAGVFAEDSWKASPKLTLNVGLRWDYTGPVSEDHNRLAGFDVNTGQWYLPKDDADTPKGILPAGVVILNRKTITKPDYTNFAPRLGLAYHLFPRTVISAGVGVQFDSWSGATQAAQNARGAWPSGSTQSPSNLNNGLITPGATAQNPFGTNAPVIPSTPFPSGGGFLDTAWKNAYSWQWNLEIQQDIARAGTVKLAYVGSATSRSPIQVPSNVYKVLGDASSEPFSNMQYGFNEIQSIGHMSYNALQAQYIKRYSDGLAVNASFTWSRNINVGCADYWEGCNIQDPYDMRTNRSVDDVDVPVIFTLSSVYELPIGTGKPFVNSGVPAKLLGGWQVNGILSARAGTPFTLGLNSSNDNANGGSQRPNVSGPTKGPRTLTEWFNTAAYSQPLADTYGNVGRNSLFGPHYTDVDFSLFRNFSFLEHYRAQFRIEAFNMFNHPNFGNPDSGFGDQRFGAITGTSGNPRELQLAGTFKF
jgi:hypothetical protein